MENPFVGQSGFCLEPKKVDFQSSTEVIVSGSEPKETYATAKIWFAVCIALIVAGAMMQNRPATIAASDDPPSISTPVNSFRARMRRRALRYSIADGLCRHRSRSSRGRTGTGGHVVALDICRWAPLARKLPTFSALDFEIFRRGLAPIRDFLVLDDLTLIQTGETGLLDGRDVNEYVFPAALRLDEPETLLRIEPLHGATRHLIGLQSRGLA
jgi:hypothetical protein